MGMFKMLLVETSSGVRVRVREDELGLFAGKVVEPLNKAARPAKAKTRKKKAVIELEDDDGTRDDS